MKSGSVSASVLSAFVLAPRTTDVQGILLFVGSAVLLVVPVAVLVLVMSVMTSVHGVATTAVLLPLVGIAVLGSWTRAGPAVRTRAMAVQG
ncbi:hypothetical protein [Nocardioides hwasunensis]|uniref:Uncharacterized protein n=1 Tax=Nocardioides hwasunensis TaxID=397258 RepID=A0ABR8MCA1_9ACTN|nr:hypothetical protein [Nocardioides hwasunensis]MBD3913488.1 hypothetical protein [Nocardioides hwasunensis]